METLSTQVRSLLDEVEKRENAEIQLADTQAKLKASLNERKMMVSFRVSMEEVEAEMGVLRTQNRELQDKFQQMQQQVSLSQSGTTQEQVKSLIQQQDEHEIRYKKKSVELDAQISKAKELHGRVVVAESRANEVQKKYDECKRNYFKLRDERERLKVELEKVKGTSGPAGEASTITTGSSAPQNGTTGTSTSDVQA